MKLDFWVQTLIDHPFSEPEDAVKLLYQSEFGCGHLLPDEEICALKIEQETALTAADAQQPAFEPIGGGLCRLNLRNPLVRAIPPIRIAGMMRMTAGQVHGSQSVFEASLKALQNFAEATREAAPDQPNAQTALPFTADALAAYLQSGALERLPPSHSERYRKAYGPAYRVVLRRYGEAVPLICKLEQSLRERGKATLVLDGNCASGKTTLAELLAPLYPCNAFHMDDFFLPLELRTEQRLKEVGGNVHYERFRAQVLAGLRLGGDFSYDAFDFHRGVSRRITVTPQPVTLLEGSYSLHPTFEADYEALHAVRVLLRTSPEEQLRRILRRNGKTMLARFRNEWIPLENCYLEAYHTRREDECILTSERHMEDEPAEGGDGP
ncbi:MAG TPA: hypothetical protein PLP25_06195 [Candidatus Limiplasma sp.]|nr:hypothetical protein [Candidatus Limiplasma sp.]HPS81432.1 hypothetical protein [Candidatus Limiplasma sp.]